MDYDFEGALVQWKYIPLDDFAYRDAKEIIALHPLQRANLVRHLLDVRFSTKGWRNKDNQMFDFMNLKGWKGKEVLDFGCGLGLDGAVLGKYGANVSYADLHHDTLLLASNVYWIVTEGEPHELCFSLGCPPYIMPYNKFDMIWSFGVLHHTPKCGDILKYLCKVLKPGGVIKVGLCSDIRWKEFMGCDPPEDTSSHPRFIEFVRKCDAVGSYIDWYNEEKLRKTVEEFAEVKEFKYWESKQFIGAILVPKNGSK